MAWEQILLTLYLATTVGASVVLLALGWYLRGRGSWLPASAFTSEVGLGINYDASPAESWSDYDDHVWQGDSAA